MSDLIGGIAAQMKHLSARQRVIAENIANSETPGFKAREMEKPDFAGLVDSGGPSRVARPSVQPTAGMIALGGGRTAQAGIVLDPDTSETKPDGNNVTLEDQLLKMGQMQADFAAMTSLYRKSQGLIQSALGRRSGG